MPVKTHDIINTSVWETLCEKNVLLLPLITLRCILITRISLLTSKLLKFLYHILPNFKNKIICPNYKRIDAMNREKS